MRQTEFENVTRPLASDDLGSVGGDLFETSEAGSLFCKRNLTAL